MSEGKEVMEPMSFIKFISEIEVKENSFEAFLRDEAKAILEQTNDQS